MALEIPPAPLAVSAEDRIRRDPSAEWAVDRIRQDPLVGLAVDRIPPARLAGSALDAVTASGCCASRHSERGVVGLTAPEGASDATASSIP